MSKRLQVLFDEQELLEIQEIAHRNRMTVAEWVRQTLRAAYQGEPRRDAARKLELIQKAVKYNFPSGDIDQLLNEVERGYLVDGPA